MGRHTKADICPFVFRGELPIPIPSLVDADHETINGWTFICCDIHEEVGKKEELIASIVCREGCYTDDGDEVHWNGDIVTYVDEYQYEGQERNAFISDKREVLEEFLQSFGVENPAIEEEEAVQQTL